VQRSEVRNFAFANLIRTGQVIRAEAPTDAAARSTFPAGAASPHQDRRVGVEGAAVGVGTSTWHVKVARILRGNIEVTIAPTTCSTIAMHRRSRIKIKPTREKNNAAIVGPRR